MKMYRYSIVILIIVNISSCFPEDKEYFTHRYDILDTTLSQLPEETQRIDFTEQSKYEPYLLNKDGHETEPTYLWIKSTHVAVLFYTYDKRHNQPVEITWKTINSHRQHQQVADIVLNGDWVDSVIVPSMFNTTQILLPRSAINLGPNILEFTFSDLEDAQALTLNARKNRMHSVAFKDIRFLGQLTFIKNTVQGWIHQSPSSVAFFVELPANFELDIEYQNAQGTTSSLEVIGEYMEEKITVKLPAGKTNLRKRIELPHAGSYVLHLLTDGDMVWKQIQIKMPKLEEIPTMTRAAGFSKQTTPDILVYVVDTLRADHLGCYGYERKTSPNIDAFARENALYLNAYATSSWTRASGASIVTGLLPRNHSTMTREAKLPDEFVTLAEVLQQHGYYTVYLTANGNVGEVFGFAQGYVEFIHLSENERSKTIHVPSKNVNEHIFHFLHEYSQQSERKPLFMLVWTADPHNPYTPPEYAQQQFEIDRYTPIDTSFGLLNELRKGTVQPTESQLEFIKTRYDQEIFANDRSFGQLLEKLNTLEMYQDMIIVFTADHGEEFFEHGGVGHGLTLYNEQIRVPLIIKAKQLAKGTYKENAQLTDIYPTLLDILGLESLYPLDGISLLSHHNDDRILYFEENLDGNDLLARLDNTKKLIFNKQFHRPPSISALPAVETYAARDIQEKAILRMESFDDYFRLQELISYMTGKSTLNVQVKGADVTPELDQHLKDLGYVK